tara:strand:- start:287 stop:1141 length:855 start_codon:yes stop_codon:yes gene_type:complete
MVIIHAAPELREFLKKERLSRGSVGFVPTMGALHQGHASLMRRARRESQVVILSIFVNPKQFNEKADFANYPVTTEADLELARQEGVDVVFVPKVSDVYEESFEPESSNYGDLTTAFEGAKRPGHFDGVVSVVRRLFEIVQPDLAFFGEKDLQQLAVIRHLGKLEFPSTQVIGCPLIRDHDGLALSSRNVRIPKDDRQHALKLNACLQDVAKCAQASLDFQGAIDRNRDLLNEDEHIELEYFAAVDGGTFQAVDGEERPREMFAIIAAVVGGVRLIDNCRLRCS